MERGAAASDPGDAGRTCAPEPGTSRAVFGARGQTSAVGKEGRPGMISRTAISTALPTPRTAIHGSSSLAGAGCTIIAGTTTADIPSGSEGVCQSAQSVVLGMGTGRLSAGLFSSAHWGDGVSGPSGAAHDDRGRRDAPSPGHGDGLGHGSVGGRPEGFGRNDKPEDGADEAADDHRVAILVLEAHGDFVQSFVCFYVTSGRSAASFSPSSPYQSREAGSSTRRMPSPTPSGCGGPAVSTKVKWSRPSACPTGRLTFSAQISPSQPLGAVSRTGGRLVKRLPAPISWRSGLVEVGRGSRCRKAPTAGCKTASPASAGRPALWVFLSRGTSQGSGGGQTTGSGAFLFRRGRVFHF